MAQLPSPPSVQVEGVGLGSIKAAAEHADFDLSKLATWPTGAPVPFGFLADTFEAIAEESKRLAITGILCGAFRAVIATAPDDLLPMVYLCTNRVAPAHEGLELGIGDATLIKARKKLLVCFWWRLGGRELGIASWWLGLWRARACQAPAKQAPPRLQNGVVPGPKHGISLPFNSWLPLPFHTHGPRNTTACMRPIPPPRRWPRSRARRRRR